MIHKVTDDDHHEAERHLIAGLITNASASDDAHVREVFERVAPADFHDAGRGKIFAAIRGLMIDSDTPTPPAEALRLIARAADADAAAREAWSALDIEQYGCTTPNLPYHGRVVRDAAIKRSIGTAAGHVVKLSQNGVAVDEVVGAADHLAGVVADIERGRGRSPITRLSDVEPEHIRWLWPNRIARGKLTIIAGDPGLGKSFLTLDIASRISTGAGWPDRPGEPTDPGGVVLLSAEDGVADTIVPRLIAAGADRSRIGAIPAGDVTDLRADLRRIERAVEAIGDCRLVVIDPITAYLGDTDSHKNAEVRAVLAPLSALAERHDLAVVAVTHLRKGADTAAIYRIMGSLAFSAAARTVWGVVRDKADPVRLLLPIKSNIGPDRGGLAYELRDMGHGPCVAWRAGEVQTTADDAMGDREPRTSKADEAAGFIREVLVDGPLPVKDVKRLAAEAGHSWRTVTKAKDNKVRVDVSQVYDEQTNRIAGWQWALEDNNSAP